MRYQHEDKFILDPLNTIFSKEILEYRNLGQTGNAGDRVRVSIFENAGQQTDFSLAQPNIMFYFPLTDNRLLNASDIRLSCLR